MSVEVYPDRDSWLAARESGIGGSEAAAVLGRSPYVSRYTLWARKCGLVESDVDGEAWHLRRGNYFEPAVVAMWRDETGRRTQRTPFTIIRDDEFPFIFATPDTLHAPGVPKDGGCEIKTSTATTPADWEDGPPIEVQIQVQQCMRVTGADEWSYAALLNMREPPVIGTIARNDRFIEAMVAEECRFWEMVQAKQPPAPDDSEDAERTIKRLFPRDVGPGVILGSELRAAQEGWIAADEALADARRMERAAQKVRRGYANVLRAAIGNNVTGRIQDGGGRFTLTETHKPGGYRKASRYRVLRWQEDKKK